MPEKKQPQQLKLEVLTIFFILLKLNRLTPLRSGPQGHDRSFYLLCVL